MGKLIKVEGFDACFEKIEELKGKTTLFIMFSGSKDEKTGKLEMLKLLFHNKYTNENEELLFLFYLFSIH